MIEVVSETKCVKCNMCVTVCPTNVFDRVDNGIPVIARQSDCQTCFMCELYCPTDALFVDPHPESRANPDEGELEKRGLLGAYREKVGWGPGRKPVSAHHYMFELAKRAIP